MAINLGSGFGDEQVENADINITPFIDVILVLLIIFMVAAPLSTVDVAIDLPTSNAMPQQRPEKPIFVSVKSDLGLVIGDRPVERSRVVEVLDTVSNKDHEQRIFLQADKGVRYGDLMVVMNLLRADGCLKIGLVGLEDTLPGGQP